MEYENKDTQVNTVNKVEKSTLEKYRDAVDAEKQALNASNIDEAMKYQEEAKQYMEILSEDEKGLAIEYKRGTLLQLGKTDAEVAYDGKNWVEQNLKGFYRVEDAQARNKATTEIGEQQLKESELTREKEETIKGEQQADQVAVER